MQLCNPMELDDNELNALKTYFQQRGLQLPNENLVVVIKNRQEKVLEKQFENIRRNKEKWQNIYEKYKEKYQVSTLSFQDPGAQSTPKIVEPSVSKISEPPKSIPMEKGSQTSLVKNAVKSTQVETNCLISKEQTTLDEKTQEQLEMYPSEIAESFEFVRGSKVKESKKKSLSESSGKFDTKKSISTESEAGSSKNSGISMSVKNESVANFDDSLKVAIALLNSLLESSMRPELKRNLAEKVIQKIVQLQTSRSIQTSTLESSEIYPQSNSSADPSVKVKSAETKSSHKNREEVLKNCFQPMTKSEISHQNSQADEEEEGESIKESNTSQSIPKSQLVDFVRREKQTQLKWIEKEIEHLNNLRMLLKRNETPLPTPIYENMTGLRNKPLPPEKPLAAVPSDANVWNSHVNMKKVKNRSKLETPVTHDESLASFIDTKNKKFLEKYNKHQKQMYEEINAYTRPYSSKPPTTIKSKRTQLTANKDVQTSTSLASSSVFESDASMSVPMTSSTNSQQQSQPENKKKEKQKVASAVTQTTDSICRTKPIYEVRSDATVSTVTRRVQKLQNDKQLQCHPPSIKYTLTFDKKNKPNVRQYSSLPQRSQYATITKSSKDMYNQISYSASLNYERYVENKENYNDILLASDNGDDVDEVEDIDLRKCFNQNRPEVFTRFEERKKCIEELKKLRWVKDAKILRFCFLHFLFLFKFRALRNEHRAKLLLLTSEKSLEGKLFSSLPDLPLKTTRIFSTKAIKQHTKKVVKNLTEVQQRKKEENLKNLKRKTRLMTEIFNKNLQKNVLKGNLNLSNTVNLIAK